MLRLLAGLFASTVFVFASETHAQTVERTHLIGVIQVGAANEAQAARNLTLFQGELQKLGWTDGKNVRFEVRQSSGDIAGLGQVAKELVDLKPDVIVANSTPAVTTLARETTSLPIVFINIVDPVSIRLVASLERPGGNLTGIVGFRPEIAVKWVETLKEIAPRVSRIALIFNPATNAETWQGYMRAARSFAQPHKIEMLEAPINNPEEIERTIGSYADDRSAGLIVVPSTFAFAHRQRIAAAAVQHNVPAMYGISPMVRSGGLVSLGPDVPAQWGAAASPVDRILRGVKPTDVPVVLSRKVLIAINLKTAKALGLTVPPSLLARADEVIE